MTVDEGDPKALFSIATTPRCKGRHHSFPCLFVAASHQIGLDTRSKARKPIKGRERAETRTLLVYAAHRLTWCNVSQMRQAVSRTQMWVRAHMLGYGFN